MKIPRTRWLLLLSVVTLLCCDVVGSESSPYTPPVTALPSVTPSPSPTTTTTTTTPDGAAVRLTSCVDRPTDLPRPPTGRLPCELVPPGLTL